MHEELDIAIEVRFQSDRGVPAELVQTITQRIARVLHDEEKDELEAMFKHFEEWTAIERDAMRYRFGELDRDLALIIEYGGKGSLLLFGAAAGLAYWVVDKTLGETFKQAWIESDGHDRVKAFLKARVFRKRSRIAKLLPRLHYRMDGADTVTVTTEEQPIPRVVVTVTPDESVRIPKPSEIATARNRD